jgi:hypothetical protein
MLTPSEEETDAREVWSKLQDTKDPRSREDLLIQLAKWALGAHDFTDPEAPDDLHDALCDLRVRHTQYQVAALRVGRLVAQHMELEDSMIIIPIGPEESPN